MNLQEFELARKYGQQQWFENCFQNHRSYCELSKWNQSKRAYSSRLDSFYQEQGVLSVFLKDEHGVVLRPHFDQTSMIHQRPALAQQVILDISKWLRERNQLLSEFEYQADHFNLIHGLGEVLFQDAIAGRSMDLPIALAFLSKEFSLNSKELWAATGKLEWSQPQLAVQEVLGLTRKINAFFREFPETKILIPYSNAALQIQKQNPEQIFLVRTFSEAVELVFGQEQLELGFQKKQKEKNFRNPMIIWKELCNRNEYWRLHPREALSRWKIAENSVLDSKTLSREANAYRVAAYVFYATSLGKDLSIIENDFEVAKSYLRNRGSVELSNRLEKLRDINVSLDQRLDYSFLEQEVLEGEDVDSLCFEDYARLGWWAMLVAKTKEKIISQREWLQRSEKLFQYSSEVFDLDGIEPCRKAQIYNHFAELYLLKKDANQAKEYYSKSKILFQNFSNADLYRQNQPYWDFLQIKILRLEGKHQEVLQFPFRDTLQDSHQGFLKTEQLRSMVIEGISVKELKIQADKIQELIAGEETSLIRHILSWIPQIEILPLLTTPEQHYILRNMLNTLKSCTGDFYLLQKWRELAESALHDVVVIQAKELRKIFLILMPYNYDVFF
ncbi:MAG: hypothetical protein ACI86H_002080 [bacterium]|jgi:hypothetical protein